MRLMKTQPSRSVSCQVEFHTTFFFTLVYSYFEWTVQITTVLCFGAYNVVQVVNAENRGMKILCALHSADLLALTPQGAKACRPMQRYSQRPEGKLMLLISLGSKEECSAPCRITEM